MLVTPEFLEQAESFSYVKKTGGPVYTLSNLLCLTDHKTPTKISLTKPFISAKESKDLQEMRDMTLPPHKQLGGL